MRVLYLVNCSQFFSSHFLHLALAVKAKGHIVAIAAGNDMKKDMIEELGFEFFEIKLTRSGKNVFSELESIWSIIGLYRSFRPQLVHMFTIKPILYGCLVDRLIPSISTKKLVTSITGLGSASLSESLINRGLWKLIKLSYKLLLSPTKTRVIFENIDDQNFFINNSIVSKKKCFLVNGAGVDILKFTPSTEKSLIVTVVFVARLLKDKGVREYIEAGKILARKGAKVKLLLVGSVDVDNPSSMNKNDILDAHNNGYVNYLGQRDDIDSIYKNSHIGCLPSYREGLPKSLIEAAACGLAIVTSDVPGCRQMVINESGKCNGILVKVKNAEDLAYALEVLSQDKERLVNMGQASRVLAETKFSYSKVNSSFFDIYNFDGF